MNICVIGTGYVGLVQGVILSEFGMNVVCVDTDEHKIDALNSGKVTIYEPGLQELLDKNMCGGRLRFTTDTVAAVENSDVVFIAVGTPPCEDGSVDLTDYLRAVEELTEGIHGYKVIVNKSTVPVGTGKRVKELISESLSRKGIKASFDVVSNPEFLREGRAVKDCLLPDRIVIGAESDKAREIMKKIYNVLYLNKTPFVFCNWETAEMIKYASNAFLAVKISYVNELSRLCEKVGANVQDVALAMGMDGRISPKFLHAGAGYGGSCFPKDTRALADTARQNGEYASIVEAAIQANETQRQKMVEKIVNNLGNNSSLADKIICVLGLSFKPETDDMREAPSIGIIGGLIQNGARIRTYCPQGMREARVYLKNYQDKIAYARNEYEAAEGADAIVLLTEWHQFRGMDLAKMYERMKNHYFFDLRNVFAKDEDIRKTFRYFGVGV